MKTPEDFLRDNAFVLAHEIDRGEMIGVFLREMEAGLRGEASSLPMIPAFVGVDGRVKEGRKVAVLDAGGTNFRSAVVSVPPMVSERENRPMPGAQSEVTEEEFYGALVGEVKRVIGKADGKRVGFCFSYPAEATRELDAKLNRWTKNIKAPSIVGQYVGSELARRVGEGVSCAVVNDTVATLLAAKATEGEREYSSYIGFILGTGTNTAYVEKNSNIAKLEGLDPYGSMIINAESGSFDKVDWSRFDEAMDKRQTDPGHNRFEKMIAGAYLGQIAYEVYVSAAQNGFFDGKILEKLEKLGTIETRDLNEFCAADLARAEENALYSVFTTEADVKMARRLGLPIFERAAVLTAVHLAAFVIKSGEGVSADRPVAINVDGSTFYKTRAIQFADTVRRELTDMLTVRRNIYFEIVPRVEDAPMVGAAIAAMMGEGNLETSVQAPMHGGEE